MNTTEFSVVDTQEYFSPESQGRVSHIAQGLIPSEILKVGAEIRAMIAAGSEVCNLTVGDFAPAQFPIPELLREFITEALARGETNYPPSDGMPSLRKAVVRLYEKYFGLSYPTSSVLIASGARPVIYGAYRTLVDRGEKVLYPVPSWNNNHYCHLAEARGVPIVCSKENGFLPTVDLVKKEIKDARMLALTSPLNPTGTAFSEEQLGAICDLVLEENDRRKGKERPLYILYDQIYWLLTFGGARHVNPVMLRPELANYTVFVDGISKSFASTGLRVGWCVAPPDVASRMAGLIGHIGAWAPRAEQVATAQFMSDEATVESYLVDFKMRVNERLTLIYDGVTALKHKGLPVDVVAPEGAIYATARFALAGKKTRKGELLKTDEDVRKYLLGEAGMAVVGFHAFGATEDTGWYRLSVGAVSVKEIEEMLPRLEKALVSCV